MDYRKRFKELRLQAGLTQMQVGAVCNVSDATVGHWENLKREMSVDDIITLCKFYHVSADYILGLQDTATGVTENKK